MKHIFAAVLAAAILFFTGYTMNDFTMERVNASFRMDFAGNITAEAPEAVLIKSRAEFSKYLSEPSRFFDGRFMFYEEYEGNDGAFFSEHDLVAVIVQGGAEGYALTSAERQGNNWLVTLEPLANGGEEYFLYFVTVPKIDGMTNAVLVTE